ncbi:MAG: dihydropteroate synthase [Anaerolineae bacterium]|nr:dihydropteroate synthase [Anaerolineae bacterium]MDW8071292.1 dihydropteroate synthase [Anaerolineae bacterium]
MYIIGENIHIISPRVKEALAEKNIRFFQELALKQVEAGAHYLDLNIGPQKKAGHEIMPWLVKGIQEVVDVPLVLDTTNLAAIEEGLKVAKHQCIINSTSAEEERLATVPPLAKKYNAKLIALTMGKSGIPVSAEERVNIALEYLIPRAVELGIPMEDLLIDPLVLTVSGCQEYCPECVEAIRLLKLAGDPPPMTNAGLSNVSNAVPSELRPLINRTYLVMLMAVGLDYVIANPLDQKQNEFIRIVTQRDDSTALGRLVLKLYDKTAAGERLTADDVDMSDPEQVALFKTAQILYNQIIYTDSYLRV